MKRIVLLLLAFMTVVSLAACKPANSSSTSTTEPSDSQPTSEPTTPSEPTAPSYPPEELEEHRDEYGGKVFYHCDDMDKASITARRLMLYPDGTYYSDQSPLSADGPVTGTWTLEGNVLTLYASKTGYEDELIEYRSTLQYEDGVLTFMKGEHDILSLKYVADGTQYIIKSVFIKKSETT